MINILGKDFKSIIGFKEFVNNLVRIRIFFIIKDGMVIYDNYRWNFFINILVYFMKR